jgi:dehydrogenase/reductase SDR family member 12
MTVNWISAAVTGALDQALDILVVPGFSAIGPALRRHWWAADSGPFVGTPDIIVTGAASGLGEATAAGLASLGARVHLLGRNADRLAKAAARIRRDQADAQLVSHVVDVSDLDSVRTFAATWGSQPLHGLIHNAGVIPPKRSLSAQGHEMALATHVLGPLALTLSFREPLRTDGDGRVVWVSSGGMYSAPLVEDLEFAGGEYSGVRAYARTKRMQVVLAELLAARFINREDPVVHSMHPGWAATPGITGSIPGFARLVKPILRTPAAGADTAVWLAAADLPSHSSGHFWHDRLVRRTHVLPWQHDDPALREHLWQTCLDALEVTDFR